MFKTVKFLFLLGVYFSAFYIAYEGYGIKEPAFSWILLITLVIADLSGWIQGFFDGIAIYKKHN